MIIVFGLILFYYFTIFYFHTSTFYKKSMHSMHSMHLKEKCLNMKDYIKLFRHSFSKPCAQGMHEVWKRSRAPPRRHFLSPIGTHLSPRDLGVSLGSGVPGLVLPPQLAA